MASLRLKLVAPFIIGTLVLAGTLVWYVKTNAHQAVEEATLLIAEAKTNQTVSAINVFFKSMTASIHNTVADPHVLALFNGKSPQNEARKKAREWLTTMVQGNEFYRDMYVVDKTGKCIVSSNPGHINVSFSNKTFVHSALDGIYSISQPSIGRVTKNFSATIAGPIDVNGEILGALVIINEFPQLLDYDTKAQHGSQSITTLVLAADGTMIAHHDKDQMGKTSPKYKELYANLVRHSADSGFIVTYSLNNKNYLGFAKVTPGSKWLVITSGVDEDIFAVADQVSNTVQRISLVFLLVISVMVIIQANSILSSLFSLISYAKRIAEGETSLVLSKTTRKDEIGILHNSLCKLVETLQKMIAKLNEASEIKGRFLANMSHEIRTPLNAIIGISHVAQRDSTLSMQQNSYLAKINHSAKMLLYLINDILDLSKVESGMLTMEHASFNLHEVIKKCAGMLQEAAASKGLLLSIRYEKNAPEHFIGDALRVGQILNNLVSNAIKFTMAGSVIIKCWQEEISSDNLKKKKFVKMHISVTDSGIGIPEESQKRLFQPFSQADPSITRKFGGTGLGLAISNKLVKCMNGEFDINSEVDKGTTFHFFIELEKDTSLDFYHLSEKIDKFSFSQVYLSDKKILIAEDNEVNQFVISEILAPTGAKIAMVANGQEALNALRNEKFDMILMDMQMPVMDGLAATKEIRKLTTKEELPIIAVTANAMDEDKIKGLACGMNDYLTKPIDPLALLRVLRIWLHKL